MKQHDTKSTVQFLEELLSGGNAHATFHDAVKNISIENVGKKVQNIPYTIWQLVEHLRIAQWDILEFSRDENHKSPKWPDEYWVKSKAPEDEKQWKESLKKIDRNLKEFIQLLKDNEASLATPFSYGDGQSLFKEALTLADHNSYHTGEIILIRRLLRIWNNS